MYVERWTGGLVKPHTFFEFDDEGIDGAADEATSFAVSSTLVRLGSTTAVVLCRRIIFIIRCNKKIFVIQVCHIYLYVGTLDFHRI